jgi:hypothetical protein
MKKVVLLKAILVSMVFATDYSGMTLDEMLSARGTVAQEDKDSFRTEMQSKMQSLSPEERESYRQSNQGMRNSSNSNGTSQRLRDGSGAGGMYKGSRSGGSTDYGQRSTYRDGSAMGGMYGGSGSRGGGMGGRGGGGGRR